MCDPAIPYPDEKDTLPTVFATSSYFHKVFLKSGGYGIGLSAAQAIVQIHQGQMEAAYPSQDTVAFTVLLPR